MSKYKALEKHLRAVRKPRIETTFSQVEKILASPLPPAARRYPAWWSNNEGSHVQARAWRDAGYRTERVDVVRERVTFVAEERSSPRVSTETASSDKAHSARDALFGCMKGTTIVSRGVDLTQPTAPEWGENGVE